MKNRYSTSLQKSKVLRFKQHRFASCVIMIKPSSLYECRCWIIPNLDIYFDFDLRTCCKKYDITILYPYDIAKVLEDLSKCGLFNDYQKFKEEFGFLIPH